MTSPAADETLAAGEAALVHNPGAFQRPFPYRADKDLPFDAAAMPRDCPVMLDTKIYIARLQGKLPPVVAEFIDASVVVHSSAALSEISISAGIRIKPAASGHRHLQ